MRLRDLGFYASLDGGFDLGGGGDVVGGVESFEHGVRDGRMMGDYAQIAVMTVPL